MTTKLYQTCGGHAPTSTVRGFGPQPLPCECPTLRPVPRVSGVTATGLLERVRAQRAYVLQTAYAVVDAIDTWRTARDAETRAAMRGMRTAEHVQATAAAEAELLRLEELSASAEAALATLEAAVQGAS